MAAPGGSNLAVLDALDSARTQMYHMKAIVIAGMGFFTDAYDLFCISTVSKLLGRIYYPDDNLYIDKPKPGTLPVSVNNMVTGVALVGTLMGQLVFGYFGDKLGRKRVYGITLVLMAACAIGSGLSFGSSAHAVIGTLCFFRFWLGFGIGGDYPLSATIMSEYSNKKTRGAFIAAVFGAMSLNWSGSPIARWQNAYLTGTHPPGYDSAGLFFPGAVTQCVPYSTTSSRPSTWGAVKSLYR